MIIGIIEESEDRSLSKHSGSVESNITRGTTDKGPSSEMVKTSEC